ncbi:cytochrome c553 [Pseudacidovorax intermedius]|uniref:Cytochrome c553 n=1 Tax=Pseudacidovorax intermedius TaxID=433924 RepID=A0A370FAE3_9BURK|nr:c-type cytochrome [Pseudacidovorax intermedius]RDI21903.1 cytochrome c553 [Pseudacidovorax intermedius]
MRPRRARLTVLVLALLAGTATSAQAADEMQRRMAACTTCHGREGLATNSGYFPRLAGKPAGYLYDQLRSFRDGRRQQADMNHLLAQLSDAYLREMAEYFAGLDLPYPSPTPSDLPAAELARGRALVVDGDAARGIPACVRCHGPALTGVQPGIPGLLGLPRLYIASQLGAWVTGDRRALAPDCMAEVGRRLKSEDIRAVAGWLAAQPVPVNYKAVPAYALPAGLPVACSAMEAHR